LWRWQKVVVWFGRFLSCHLVPSLSSPRTVWKLNTVQLKLSCSISFFFFNISNAPWV
jgi:hypothetical protein